MSLERFHLSKEKILIVAAATPIGIIAAKSIGEKVVRINKEKPKAQQTIVDKDNSYNSGDFGFSPGEIIL